MTLSIFFNDLQKEQLENVCQISYDDDFLTVFVLSDELDDFGQPMYIKRLNYFRCDISKIRVFQNGGESQ